MHDSFLAVTEMILRFQSHKDLLIRRTVMSLIPDLAGYDTQTFCETFLGQCMRYLLKQLAQPTERAFGAP